MRNDPYEHTRQTNAPVGRGAVIMCYAAFGLALAFLIALIVIDHHETTDRATAGATARVDRFGIEELIDLLTTEPTAMPTDLFGRPKPVTRAGLDPETRH
jgi:hypothetical protein